MCRTLMLVYRTLCHLSLRLVHHRIRIRRPAGGPDRARESLRPLAFRTTAKPLSFIVCLHHPSLMRISLHLQSVPSSFFACGEVCQTPKRELRRKTVFDFDSGQASRALWSLRQRYASADASPRSDLRLHGWHLCFPNPEGPEWHIIRSCPPSDPGVVSQDTKEMRTGDSRFTRCLVWTV